MWTDEEQPAELNRNRLKDLDIAKSYYDARFSGSYMESWPVDKCARIAELIRELPLPRKGRVLDFGCGTGVFTSALKEMLPNWEVYGTDISGTALELAQARLPQCLFKQLVDIDDLTGSLDLIFTHHVLEHVADLPVTAALFGRLLSCNSSMFHILPCADLGSFEHSICMMRLDGMIVDSETRFFYDEEGHLRRLSTENLVELCHSEGFRLERAYYANQFYGGVKFLTEHGLHFILNFVDPKAAVSRSAARQLYLLRALLVVLWCLRQPSVVVNNKIKFGLKNLRDCFLMAAILPMYPVSSFVERCIAKLTQLEWKKSRRTRGGSEMYIFLSRGESK